MCKWDASSRTNSPPTAADIAMVVATAVQTNSPQPKDLRNAIVATLGTAGLIGGAGGGGGTPGGCTVAPLPSLYMFNSAGLPPDVALCFEAKSEHKLISKTTLSTPFSTGNMYYLQGTHHLVLANGMVYVAPDGQINEKDVLKNPMTCKDDTPSGVHQWYEVFVSHVMGHHVYAHPLWCYKKDHGGHWGFTAGNNVADDLPQCMAGPLNQMSAIVFTLLQSKDMFPPNSRCTKSLQSCYGDGYTFQTNEESKR